MSVTPVERQEARSLAAMLGYRGSLEGILDRYASSSRREAPVRGLERRWQLKALAIGGLPARMASTWAARWDRSGPLRRREALMLALLECRPESMAAVDRSSDGGPWAAWPRFIFWGILEVCILLLAIPVFGCARICGGRS